jgi:formate hydrogenlyase transcriptional activator
LLHSWPGNVRELQNFIERSVILSTGAVLHASTHELNDRTQADSKSSRSSGSVTLEQAERSHILRILEQTEGVVSGPSGAAVRLGMPRTTLIARMKRLGINHVQISALPVRAVAAVPT